MDMYQVDARGLSCPEPVLLTAEAMKKHGGENICVLVDEAHTRANVEKYIKSQGKSCTVAVSGSEYAIEITAG